MPGIKSGSWQAGYGRPFLALEIGWMRTLSRQALETTFMLRLTYLLGLFTKGEFCLHIPKIA
jgi:hypothetical protein